MESDVKVDKLPFSVQDAQRIQLNDTEDTSSGKLHLDTRLNNRVIDLRVSSFKIFLFKKLHRIYVN